MKKTIFLLLAVIMLTNTLEILVDKKESKTSSSTVNKPQAKDKAKAKSSHFKKVEIKSIEKMAKSMKRSSSESHLHWTRLNQNNRQVMAMLSKL